MSKCIYEYDKDNWGMPRRNVFTVVYENSTFYCCEETGSDSIIQIYKHCVDLDDGHYFTENKDDQYFKDLENYKIENIKGQIQYDKNEIERLTERLKNLKGDLVEKESEYRVLDMERTLNKIEELTSHHKNRSIKKAFDTIRD